MLVCYRFPVTGRLRLEFSFPLRTQWFTYDFETNEHGVLKFIRARASVPDRTLWPLITPNPQPGVKANFQMSSPYFPTLRRDMRAVAGILCLFGVEDIAVEEAEESWEAENDEEKQSLAIFSMKRTVQDTHPTSWPQVPFDFVGRAFLAAERAGDFEAALNFFRKGRLDVMTEHYLDAALDFLFMVETTYANGKFKTAHVEAEYLASDELLELVAKTLRDPLLRANVRGHDQIESSFARSYEGKAADEVIKHLVRLRGELHHHSSRKSGIWHPTDHVRFGADALFLQQLCLGVAFAIAGPTLDAAEIVQSYRAQEHSSASAGTVKVHRSDA